jgi:hypothetical protein
LEFASSFDPLAIDVVLEFHSFPLKGFQAILVLSVTIDYNRCYQNYIYLCKNIYAKLRK